MRYAQAVAKKKKSFYCVMSAADIMNSLDTWVPIGPMLDRSIDAINERQTKEQKKQKTKNTLYLAILLP
jgi:hypothetical protein